MCVICMILQAHDLPKVAWDKTCIGRHLAIQCGIHFFHNHISYRSKVTGCKGYRLFLPYCMVHIVGALKIHTIERLQCYGYRNNIKVLVLPKYPNAFQITSLLVCSGLTDLHFGLSHKGLLFCPFKQV